MKDDTQRHLTIDLRFHFTVPDDLGLNGLDKLVTELKNRFDPKRQSPFALDRRVPLPIDRTEYLSWALPDRGYTSRTDIDPEALEKALEELGKVHAAASAVGNALVQSSHLPKYPREYVKEREPKWLRP